MLERGVGEGGGWQCLPLSSLFIYFGFESHCMITSRSTRPPSASPVQNMPCNTYICPPKVCVRAMLRRVSLCGAPWRVQDICLSSRVQGAMIGPMNRHRLGDALSCATPHDMPLKVLNPDVVSHARYSLLCCKPRHISGPPPPSKVRCYPRVIC